MSVSAARAASARATIVLAARVATRRDLYAQALEEAGLAIVHTREPESLVNAVRQAGARLVVLDLGLSQADTLSCIRVLKRNPQTREVPVLVLCRPTTDRAEQRELISTGAFEATPETLTETALLARVERALQFAPEPTAAHQTTSATMHVPGNSSLLMRPLRCMFHKPQKPFSYYLLRAGRIAVDVNFHDVPVYSATGNEPFADYHVLSVAVCPVCHFASADPDYFEQPGNARAAPFTFDAPTRAAIAAGGAERAPWAAKLSPAFTSHERTVADGLVAHELAIATSRTLARANLHTFALELVRMGNYHLRAAVLAGQLGASPELIVSRQKKALEIFKDAYVYVEGPAYYRNAYQIIALAISFGDDALAHQYVTRLREATRSKPASGDEHAIQERYLALAQKAWEDREYHRA